jgi:hypothetical protein
VQRLATFERASSQWPARNAELLDAARATAEAIEAAEATPGDEPVRRTSCVLPCMRPAMLLPCMKHELRMLHVPQRNMVIIS